jgi:hypothetical protein
MKKAIKNISVTILLIVLTLNSCINGKKEKAAGDSQLILPVQTEQTAVPVEPVDMQRVAQIAAMLPEKPGGFGKSYHDREAWENLGKRTDYQAILKTAEDLLGKPFPAWNDEAYLIFFTKGTRPEGEKMLRDRSSWLGPLVISECLENKGRFVPTIEMVLKELIKQKSWTLPAHDSNKQNFEGRNFTVDLNVAGFGHSVAQALFLLDDKLSPKVRKDVLDALYARMFNPVLRTIETKNGDHWWLTTTNNWNAVCLAGVTGAALAAIPDKTERAKFVTIGERYSKNSIIGFADDGYCSEGLGYFAYGFGNYIVLREEILQATGGAIDLFADEKIKRIGAYAPNMEIMNNIYPSIADCRAGTKAPSDILWYCSRNLGLGLEKYDTLSVKGSAGNLVSGLMYAFPNSASLSKASKGDTKLAPGIRSDFNYAGVLIVRPAAGTPCNIAVALKGGNNNEHHNHNDVGSYSVVVGDEMLMGDPGGPNMYRSNTFGPERYTAYKNLASYGHPVPLVAGEEQFPGKEAQAKIIKKSFSEKKDLFVMDIASAYKVEGLKLVRSFTFDRRKEGNLIVRDEFSFKEPGSFETALTSRAKCSETGKGKIEFSGERNKMVATIKAPGEFEIGFETIQGDFAEFTRIAIRLKDPVKSGIVEIVFTPVK